MIVLARRIVITSGKGGVGKSTITANLGISLAMQAKKVVLVDADIGLNNLDVIMSIENKVVYDIEDVATEKCRIKQALVQDTYFSTLYTLPSTKYLYKNKIDAATFTKIINQLNDFDYVLIDCPAGIEEGFHRAVSASQEAIVVTTPHISAIRDADKVVSLLVSYDNIKTTGLVVNRLKGKQVLNGLMMDPRDIAKILRITLKGAIPEDDHMSTNHQIYKEKFTNNSIQTAYKLLAECLEGEHSRIFDCSSDYRGLLKKIQNIFRR